MCIGGQIDSGAPDPQGLRNPPQETGPLLLTQAGGDNSGSTNLARVHRAEWEDYKSRFVPVENELFDMYYDDAGRKEAVKEAGLTMEGAFDRSMEQGDRNLQRYGIKPTERQQKQREKGHKVAKAAAVAGAQNAMRTAKEDQKMGIVTGAVSDKRNQGG